MKTKYKVNCFGINYSIPAIIDNNANKSLL